MFKMHLCLHRYDQKEKTYLGYMLNTSYVYVATIQHCILGHWNPEWLALYSTCHLL